MVNEMVEGGGGLEKNEVKSFWAVFLRTDRVTTVFTQKPKFWIFFNLTLAPESTTPFLKFFFINSHAIVYLPSFSPIILVLR